MSAEHEQSTGKKFPYVWLVWGLPAVVVCASFITLYFALRGADDMVIDDYYREGLAWNRKQAADTEAARLNLRARLRYQDGEIVVELPEVAAQELLLTLSHPSERDADQVLRLQPTGEARWALKTTLPPHPWYAQLQPVDGSWRLRARWQPTQDALLQPEIL